MLNRWMTTGIIAVAIIIFISVTQVQVYAENRMADKPVSETANLEKLLRTADWVIGRMDRLVIKWQAGGKGDAQEHAVKLATELGLGVPVQMQQGGHQVYRSEGTFGNAVYDQSARVLLNAVDTDNDGYYIIVQLSGGRNLDRDILFTCHGQVAEGMAKSGLKANWNMSVQGMVHEKNTTNVSATGMKHEANGQLAVMEARLSRVLQMKAMERYEDEATESISYQVTDLPLEIQSGTHALNMQLAVHHVSEQQAARITVGFPVITIEY
ncbi:YwmB family TATA-box binding protein [Paenibacillus barcinonensis]|uniref:TATA-box binding protein n=1 Tax=Paenibacillus barcinonensis TaxID=198119 RepID=A0A2V4V331_PAEBA|nr:YwmB family TATA-box binding protein [Paenibacillus barcinonensis]PYE43226.1 TATA-box binding protein [Paenibacillus barcinonensis]QKS57035.1 YwmB family TATA-box binding protein [Paenibacillus barcinonensis]